MKLRHLEMKLERRKGYERPRADLEQYQTPPVVAARLLFHACMRGDIRGKRVCDLGCGNGILACGAALLGAASVAAVDVDPGMVGVAEENARMLGTEIDFQVADISDARWSGWDEPFDTILMNPPFGAQKVHADRPFIDRALVMGSVVYGIFNAGSREFVASYVKGRASVDEVIQCRFPIRRTFAFHRRERVEVGVEIIRLIRL